MVRYLEIHKCEECPHHEVDANTSDSDLWGKDLCFAFYREEGDDESKIKILQNEDKNCPPIPDWCPLDSPNDL